MKEEINEYTGVSKPRGNGGEGNPLKLKQYQGRNQYTQTEYSPDYIKTYKPEELTGAYLHSNQNKG